MTYAHTFEYASDRVKKCSFRFLTADAQRFLLFSGYKSIPHLVADGQGYVRDILALIPILREREIRIEQLSVPGIGRFCQYPHLPAGIVVVVFARDLISLLLEERRERIPDGGLTAMPDRERSGRIRTDIFDNRFFTRMRIGGPVHIGTLQNLLQFPDVVAWCD